MRAFTTCFLILGFGFGVSAQSGSWTWVNGSDTLRSPGVFGTQGVPSVNNSPPALYSAAQWTDQQGNFWIYGGLNSNYETLGDLWKYDPSGNTWTWVKGTGVAEPQVVYGTLGVPAISNTPGALACGSATWTDSAGDLWMFGGFEYLVNNYYNDLWRYNIISNEWTWMGGPDAANGSGVFGNLNQPSISNLPSARCEVNTAWTDAENNLWLYGGCNTIGQVIGDMWRYNPATGEWTWMAGSQLPNAYPSWGTKGVESSENSPGGRRAYTHWLAGSYLYLEGGLDRDEGLNDTWQFNLNTNYWTWIAGGNFFGDSGVYLHYCMENEGDLPSGRFEQRSAQLNNCSVNLFMWGGFNNDQGLSNDLWAFDLTSEKWRWLSGSDSSQPVGHYGSLGVSNPLNMPPGACGPCFWADKQGSLWLWGGDQGLVSNIASNAMWKYVPDPACFPGENLSGVLSYTLSQNYICPGDSVYLTISGATDATITPHVNLINVDSADYYAYITDSGSTSYTITGQTVCGLTSQSFTIVSYNNGFHLSAGETNICLHDSAQICVPGGESGYQWNNGDTTSCIYAKDTGEYYVRVTPPGTTCVIKSQPDYISVYPPTQAEITALGDTLSSRLASSYQWIFNSVPITGATSSVYIANTTGNYTVQITDSNGCTATASQFVTVTGLTEELVNPSINIFPNPTNNSWQLAVDNALLGSTVEVFDVTGRLVFKSIIENQQSFITFTNKASGVYQLRIGWQGYSFVKKLIKL